MAKPVDILTDTALGDDKRAALEAATDYATDFLRDLTGLSVKGRYIVLGAGPGSIPRVLDAAYARLDKPRPRVNLTLEVLCGGRRANAVASVDFILVCWSDTAERDPAHLRAVMVHEMFHQLQYDLSRSRGDVPSGRTRKLGPAWMVEGAAEIAELMARMGEVPTDGSDLFNLQAPARRSRLTLSDLRDHGTIRGYLAYGMARFAASLLVREHGQEGLLRYFRLLGRGMTQEQAFQTAFGQSMASFEVAFEEVRRDYGAARDWGKAR